MTLPMFKPAATEARPLRPHQVKSIELVRDALRQGCKRVVVALPTGAGKTRLAAEIVNMALDKGNPVTFTVPFISLVDQTVEAFEAEGIDQLGVIQASHPRTHYGMPVQIASVQTLVRKQWRPKARVVIVDEVHLKSKAIDRWMDEEPDTVFVGLSATPWRKGMAERWGRLVVPVTMAELIEQGFLSPFRVFAPSVPDLSGVKIRQGEYVEDQLAEVMGDAGLMADVVGTWKAKANGEPTLVFAVDRAHARKLQSQFADAGVPMGYCDAFVERPDRAALFDQMRRGLIKGIVNVGTLTTGVDADVRCIVDAQPTRSEMKHVQKMGRALRTAPGKEYAIILDHAGNNLRLGLPTDIVYHALLDGKDTESVAREKDEPKPKECPSCGVLKPPKAHQCPACGFKPEKQSEIEPEAGELVEFKPKQAKPTAAEKQAFWSMALFVDRERGKGGRLAKALYKGKFGVWPKGLFSGAIPPSPEFLSYEKSRRIAYAKRKRA